MNYNNIKTPNELLRYMQQNIKYGFVSKTGKIYDNPQSTEWKNDWYLNCVVQSGNEVLNTKHGTCWDQVELERKWFEENNYNFKTIYIWFEVNRPSNLPTHTFLVFEENNKFYWFEHSFFDNQGIHEFETINDAIEHVKKEQLKYAIKTGRATTSDYKYITAYKYSKPLPNLNVDNYIKHVTSTNTIKRH